MFYTKTVSKLLRIFIKNHDNERIYFKNLMLQIAHMNPPLQLSASNAKRMEAMSSFFDMMIAFLSFLLKYPSAENYVSLAL